MDDRYAMWDRTGLGTLRLGETLVANEVIEAHQLQEVLKRHPSSARMLGELMLDLGVVTPDQLASALEAPAELMSGKDLPHQN